MTPESSQTPAEVADTGSTAVELKTYFQSEVTLADDSTVLMMISQRLDGELQFGLSRMVDPSLYGPMQIVEMMVKLNALNTALTNYVNSRIAEAKAAAEKETQPELPLDAKSDGDHQESPACEAGPCHDECCGRQDAAHAG